jgi:hypothetical protein
MLMPILGTRREWLCSTVVSARLWFKASWRLLEPAASGHRREMARGAMSGVGIAGQQSMLLPMRERCQEREVRHLLGMGVLQQLAR